MSRFATIHVSAVEVHCPDCKEPMAESATGSFMWDTNDAAFAGGKQLMQCGICKQSFRLKLPRGLNQ